MKWMWIWNIKTLALLHVKLGEGEKALKDFSPQKLSLYFPRTESFGCVCPNAMRPGCGRRRRTLQSTTTQRNVKLNTTY